MNAAAPFSSNEPRQFGPGEERSLADSEIAIDLRQYGIVLLRSWRTIVAIFAICLLLGLLVTFLMTPIYRATTSVLINPESTKVLENVGETQAVEQALDSERYTQTQVDLISSRATAVKVAELLGLHSNATLFLERMHAHDGASDDMSAKQAQEMRFSEAVGVLQNGLVTKTDRNSRIIKISFDSPTRETAQAAANAYADAYVGSNVERGFASSSYARKFLEQRLAQTKGRLEASERDMIDYAARQRLIDAGDGATGSQAGASESPRSLNTANLVQLNTAYATALANRIQAEQRWNQARSADIFKIPEVLSDATIQTLIQGRADLEAKYADQMRLFKPGYPAAQQLKAQIDEYNSQIDTEARRTRDTLRSQFETASNQEKAIDRNIERLKNQSIDEQKRSVQYNILRRDADTNRVLYDALLQRYKEVSLAGGLAANNVSVVDAAELPGGPFRPVPWINFAVAAALGIVLAIAAVLLRDRFDDTVRSPQDLETKLRLPLLGITPLLAREVTAGEALSDPRSDLSEAYASVRAALQFATAHGSPSPLLLTSSQESEGKSASSLAIALSFAQTGRRVLLIDGDLRRPSLHNILGLSRDVGLSNVLTGQSALDELVQPTHVAGLFFLAAGPLPISPSELLSGDALSRLMSEAAGKYDQIVIDGPPVMGLADAPLIAAQVAGTIFVIEAARTHRGQSRIAISRLRRMHATLVGAILTKFDKKNGAYGRDYAYTYSYNYRSAE
jgi:succinoglycan biosynthesis transport protein ExoP